MILVAALFAGCIEGDAANVRIGVPTPGLDLLDRGSNSGYPVKEPSAFVVADQRAWKQFWGKHTIHDKPAPDPPVIDWATDAVIALVHGRVDTGGHSIYPESAIASDDGLHIRYKVRHPGEGCIVSQAQANPFYLALIPAARAADVSWTATVVQADPC